MFDALGMVIGVYLGELVYNNVLNIDVLVINLVQVIYVYPELGNKGPVPFTATLLVPVVQSKHFIPLRTV